MREREIPEIGFLVQFIEEFDRSPEIYKGKSPRAYYYPQENETYRSGGVKIYSDNSFELEFDEIKERYNIERNLEEYYYVVSLKLNSVNCNFSCFDMRRDEEEYPVYRKFRFDGNIENSNNDPNFHMHPSINRSIRIPTPKFNIYKLTYVLSQWFSLPDVENIIVSDNYFNSRVEDIYRQWRNQLTQTRE